LDYHLERSLRLIAEPKHKSLYSWAIAEIDVDGQPIGEDQIPWPYTFFFTATSCTLHHNIDLAPVSPLLTQTITPALPVGAERQHIRAELSAAPKRNDRGYSWPTTFSMFGTGREIKNFVLFIHPLGNPTDDESCGAEGSPSYTAELDFREETQPDFIEFFLFVKPKTFARFAEKISSASVNQITLSVGSVHGFYSGWSPSASTGSVKVLTSNKEQRVMMPPGNQVELLRLGHVGRMGLTINRRVELRVPEGEPDTETNDSDDELEDEGETNRIEQGTPASAVILVMMQKLASLRRAAWIAVGLLGLIFVAILFRS
jgi:hypothetical protein